MLAEPRDRLTIGSPIFYEHMRFGRAASEMPFGRAASEMPFWHAEDFIIAILDRVQQSRYEHARCCYIIGYPALTLDVSFQ